MPLNKPSNQGYSAVFAAQKKNRGAYGRKNIGEATNYKELSVQNYAVLTAERLQREKELRAETAKRRKRQRKRAQQAKRAEEIARDKTLKERKSKKKNYVNYLRGHFTKVTVNKFESPRTKVQKTIDSMTKKEFIGNNHRQYGKEYESHQLKGLKQQEQERLQTQNRRIAARNDVENQHLLNKQAFISQKEVRHNSKSLLQHLRQQMKNKEEVNDEDGDMESGNVGLNSSRLGALDLNIGLQRTKKPKKRKKKKWKKKKLQQRTVNDSLNEEIIEEDENLINMLEQQEEEFGMIDSLHDSLAEEVEENLIGNDQEKNISKHNEKKYTKIVSSPSSKNYEVIVDENIKNCNNNNNNNNGSKQEMAGKDNNNSPWKLTTEHEPSKLFDSLDLSMSMRQSTNMELRRKVEEEDDDDDEDDEEDAEYNVVNEKSKRFLPKKYINTNNIKNKPSANALTPSKIQEEEQAKQRMQIQYRQQQQDSSFPLKNKKYQNPRSMVQTEFLLDDKYAIIEKQRLKPSWLRKKKKKQTPSVGKENQSVASNYTGSVRSFKTTSRPSSKKPWGRGKLSKKQKMAMEATKRRKLYEETLKKRSEQERIQRRNTLKQKRRPVSSSRFEQNYNHNPRRGNQNNCHNYEHERHHYATTTGESNVSYRRPNSTGTYGTTYLEEQLPPSRYGRNRATSNNNMNRHNNLQRESTNTTNTMDYQHAKTKSWIEEHAQYSLNRRPASTRRARSEVSVAETAMTNYTTSKSDSNTAIVRRTHVQQRYGSAPNSRSSNNRHRGTSNRNYNSNGKNRSKSARNRQVSRRPTPQIFKHYNPSDESIEEEKIKASIERLEDRLKSKQIMALRRGSSATLRAAGSRYLEDRSRTTTLGNQQYSTQQQSAIAPVVVENHHHHYNYNRNDNNMSNNNNNNNGNVIRPLPSFNNSAIDSKNIHYVNNNRRMQPPRSPGPPPPPPMEYESNTNSSAVKKINHFYYQENDIAGSQQSQYQKSQQVESQRQLPPGLDSKSLQPCHIMQQQNSYASLKKKEKNLRANLRRKKDRKNIPNRVQAKPQPSVASSMQTTTTTLFEDVINEEKGKSGVLVNENNLHLLMTPKR